MGKHALFAQRSDELPYHFGFFGHQPSAPWEAYAETTLSGRGELCLMGRQTNTRMMLFDEFLRGIPGANPCKIHVQTMSKAILQIWRDLAKSSGWRVELQLESNFTMDSTPPRLSKTKHWHIDTHNTLLKFLTGARAIQMDMGLGRCQIH